MFQKVIIIGRVGKSPEMRFTPTGKAVTNFSVATSNKYGDKEETTWFRVVTWQKQAEVCNQYVKKGMLVMVEGRLNPDENGNPKVFTKQDGSAGSNFELTAQNVKFLSKVGSQEHERLDEFVRPAEEEDFPF